MNWPVKKFGKKVTDEMQHCSHLKVGEIAYRVDGEYDSFGPLDLFACCKECAEEQDRLADEEPVTCEDCHGEFPRKETLEWKCYDFCPSQGDEPLHICDECRKKEKHHLRVAKDNRDRDAELKAFYPDEEEDE